VINGGITDSLASRLGQPPRTQRLLENIRTGDPTTRTTERPRADVAGDASRLLLAYDYGEGRCCRQCARRPVFPTGGQP
jgi:hypothetical protein